MVLHIFLSSTWVTLFGQTFSPISFFVQIANSFCLQTSLFLARNSLKASSTIPESLPYGLPWKRLTYIRSSRLRVASTITVNFALPELWGTWQRRQRSSKFKSWLFQGFPSLWCNSSFSVDPHLEHLEPRAWTKTVLCQFPGLFLRLMLNDRTPPLFSDNYRISLQGSESHYLRRDDRNKCSILSCFSLDVPIIVSYRKGYKLCYGYSITEEGDPAKCSQESWPIWRGNESAPLTRPMVKRAPRLEAWPLVAGSIYRR